MDATPKIAFNQTVLLSISAEGRLNEWNLIRSPNVLPLTVLPPSERAPAWLLSCARSEAPKLRNLIAALCCLHSPESVLVTKFSLLLLQTVLVTKFSLLLLQTVQVTSFLLIQFLPLLPESLSVATKTVQVTSFSLLLVFPVTRLSLLYQQPRICLCYQILSLVATKLSK